MMIGTLINIASVLFGGIMGLLIGSHFPPRVHKIVITGLGLFTLAYGFKYFLYTENPLIVLGSLLIGSLLGEWWKLEDGFQEFANWLESRFNINPKRESPSDEGGPIKPPILFPNQSGDFVRGFLTASLVFCVGPMTILGSIQDGINGDYNMLAIKSIMDGFAALAFASTLGIGVLFSVIVIFLFQGGITLFASQVSTIFTPGMMNELSAVGGVLLLGIAIDNLLKLKTIKIGNFLPAIILAPLIVAILNSFGIH